MVAEVLGDGGPIDALAAHGIENPACPSQAHVPTLSTRGALLQGRPATWWYAEPHVATANRLRLLLFDGLDRANHYAILWRVQNAKKPETRARRIEQFVTLCADGKTLHPTREETRRT